jgi:Tfp pilus assembly protein PilN
MSLINLLPEDYLARRAQRRANLLCLGLFAVVMAGVLGATVVSEKGYQRTRGVRQRVDQSYCDAGKLIEQLQSLESTRSKMLVKASMTAGLLERVPRSYLLATITNALPGGAALTRLELSSRRNRTVVITKESKTQFEAAAASKRPPEAGATPMQVTLTLTGLADTDVEVAHFMSAMAGCPLVESVDLTYSQEKKLGDGTGGKQVQEQVAREFQVVMVLKGDADVQSAAGPTAALAQGDSRGGSRAGESR